MQANKLSEHELVKKCMAELCSKAGFASSEDLVQRDLEFLCESIQLKTGVLISLSTMRRLMKGEFSRIPQVATLNAIANFLEYLNWHDFKLKKEKEGTPAISNNVDEDAAITAHHSSNNISRKWLFLSGGILLLAAVGLIALLKPAKVQPADFKKASFAITKTTQSNLPNTVVFNYDVEAINADSFFIQQSWDKNRRVRIAKNGHTLTDIYYEPGYHIAKLIANDQIIKTLDVSIPTDKWFFYSKERKPLSTPIYIQSSYKEGNELLTINKEELAKSGVDVQKDNEYLYVYFPSAIAASSDNYILKFKIRVADVKNNFCPYFMCEVFCQRNFMFFTSMPKGCASEIRAQFGENYLNGKTNDLSLLSTDVKDWQDVELSIKDKKVNIRINDVSVFSSAYHESGGLITGLGFISNGLCEVTDIDFKNHEGRAIIEMESKK